MMGLLKKETLAAMIPLERVEMVPADIAGDELREALSASGHSRLPVYSGPSKNIIGILHALDYIRAGDQGLTAADLARDVVEVKPRDGVHAVLVALQRARQQMAVVVNRNGRPSGIVTVKDLVEEIVGELQDF